MAKQCKTPGCDGASGFGRNRAARDGLSRHCRDCNAARARDGRDKNPKAASAAQTRWRSKNREKIRKLHRIYMRTYRETEPASESAKAKRRDYGMRWKYGISAADVDALREKQGGKCAACDAEAELFVDHCHETNQVRGLLCHNCNTALGLMHDDAAQIRGLADYLDRSTEGDQ